MTLGGFVAGFATLFRKCFRLCYFVCGVVVLCRLPSFGGAPFLNRQHLLELVDDLPRRLLSLPVELDQSFTFGEVGLEVNTPNRDADLTDD